MSRKVFAVVLLMSAMWAQSACAQDAASIQQSGSGQGGSQEKRIEQTQAKAQAQASAARAAAGCGSNEIQFDVKTDKTQHPQAPPDATRAVIYIFSERISFDQTYRIGMDGKWMGATRDESYFFFTAEPGEHRLCWDVQKGQGTLTDQGAATTFTAEAGKVYCFKSTVFERNEITQKRKFERIDGAEGMFLVSSWPLSTSRPKTQKED
jgi:hypothetical protein